MFKKYLLSILLVFFTALPVFGGQWIIEEIPGTDFYYYDALCFDSNGVLTIGTRTGSGNPACVKFIEGAGWATTQIMSKPTGRSFECYGKWITAGKNGTLHAICEFWESTNNTSDLYYAKFDGTNWTSTAIVTGAPDSDIYDYSIVVDSTDVIHVFFRTDQYYYMYKSGASWSVPEVVSAYSGASCADGNKVYFAEIQSDGVILRQRSGGAWPAVISGSKGVTNGWIWDGSLSVNNGFVSIACKDSNEDVICFTGNVSGVSLTCKDVDVGEEKVGDYLSTAVDTEGKTHIAYSSYSFDDLKYALFTNGKWNVQTVDSTGKVGSSCQVALDTTKNPHIIYADQTNYTLKRAYWKSSGVVPGVTGPSHELKLFNNIFKPGKSESMAVQVTALQAGKLKISLYNMKSELIKVLVDEDKLEGSYTYNWTGVNSGNENVASGIYFIVTDFAGTRTVKKAVVVK